MTRQEYIEIVLSQIKNKTAKREVERELQSHIDDRIEYYTDAGYSAEYSEDKALSSMGDPDEIGEKLDKLHTNKHYIILAFLFMLLYVVGLVTANIKIHDFSIINPVDFVEVSAFSSIVSVLIFASAALSFKFSVKSKSSKTLIPFGVISIAGFFMSPYALRPACYEIISLITDFPAAVISGDYFFDGGEIFWHLDHLFLTSFLPNIIQYSLVLFVLLISLVAIVSGILSFVASNEFKCGKNNDKFIKKLSKYSKFLIVLSIIAITAVVLEGAYDSIRIFNYNKTFESNSAIYLVKAKSEFDKLEIPQTEEDVKALGESLSLNEYEMSDMEFGMLTVYQNDMCFVQIRDDDEDGIYESKRIGFGVHSDLTEKEVTELENLSIGTTLDEFFEQIPLPQIEDYSREKISDDTFDYITVSSKNLKAYCYLTFKNGALIENPEIEDYDD